MEERFTYDNIHPDHLGSWTTVTNRNGLVVQDVRFDPWGTPYYSDSTTLTLASSLLFDRGFTGHEHLMRYGLINMNGRVYDPVTSTFLSVDNFVQDPSSTQNFNRYAYCMNNPLKYTDPDGEWAHLLIGALIGGIVNLATNWSSINTFGEDLAYFGIGAAAGALSAGVGMGVSSWIGGGTFGAGFIGSTTAKTAVSSFASGSIIGGSTGFTQGFITGSGNSWMQGKTFGQGLLQGVYAGVSGLINGGINGGIMAGFDALSHGRKFWSGDYVESVSRDYPAGPNYTQPEGSKDCVPTVAKTIDHYHGGNASSRFLRDEFWIKGSDPMTCGINDIDFWEGFVPYENMTCEQTDVSCLSKIYKAFSEGADIPMTLDQGIGNDYHELLLRKMVFRVHQEWFTGNLSLTFQGWAQDPAIGYMLPKALNFNNIIRAFILKPILP